MLESIRCFHCNKKLAEIGVGAFFEIKCPKCKTMVNHSNATKDKGLTRKQKI